MESPTVYEDHVGLWADELQDWLPDTLFDVHVHVTPPDLIGPISDERRKDGLTAFPGFTWEQVLEAYSGLFPDKAITGLLGFPLPLREVNTEAANDYILGLMSGFPEIKGLILAHPKDAQRTIAQFERAREAGAPFVGVKPYYDLLGKSVYESTMPEFVPEELVEFMDREGLILMLHTSGIGMGDPENQAYVKALATRFPGIRVVLAHMGRFLELDQFFRFMDSDVLDCPSIFLETSYVARREVYDRVLGRKELWPRLLFGTDLPWGTWMGYEGADPTGGPFTYNTWHVLKAIKDAIEGLGLDAPAEERLKRGIFREHARAGLFGGA